MLLKALAAAFRKRTPLSADPAPPLSPSYAGPRHCGFVAFICDVEEVRFIASSDCIDADQASFRLRAWLPARELLRFAPVCLVPLQHVERDPQLAQLGEVRAIVVGKFSVQRITAEPARFVELATWAEAMSRTHRVVADFCDDLAAASAMIGRAEPADFQARLMRACALTASTAALREQLVEDALHGVTVIEDPYERALAELPKFAPQQDLRLAWFGVFGPPLLPLLEGQFGAIARRLRTRPTQIAFITHPSQADLTQKLGGTLRDINAACKLRFVAWSREAVAVELAAADLVLLPQDSTSAWGRVKSHNRLVETLRAGRFAIASPIPSYLELREFAWIGENLVDGVEWALAHPLEVVAKITAGQRYVEERFAPRRIGELWAATLGISETRAGGSNVVPRCDGPLNKQT